jgi:hypothetical protein
MSPMYLGIWANIRGALLVCYDRRHLLVTPCPYQKRIIKGPKCTLQTGCTYTVLYRHPGKELDNVGLHMGGEGCVRDSSKGMISVWSNHKARCAQQFLLYTVLPCHPDPVYGHFRSASRRLMPTFCAVLYICFSPVLPFTFYIFKSCSDSSSIKVSVSA